MLVGGSNDNSPAGIPSPHKGDQKGFFLVTRFYKCQIEQITHSGSSRPHHILHQPPLDEGM